uniref:Uncharacterized protein n=1 Tax=Lotus japonicus TaxID=34305 RepID=I3SCY8_LOTJA|nr:unknown [Lotus japonicus]
MVPSGRPCNRIFTTSINGPISNSASPILSSKLNRSLSYTNSLIVSR